MPVGAGAGLPDGALVGEIVGVPAGACVHSQPSGQPLAVGRHCAYADIESATAESRFQ